MSPSVPSSDRLAIALWRRGAAREAMELAYAAIVRGDPGAAACRVALERMRHGQSPDDGGPEIVLDLDLVRAMLELGQLFEARSVLRGGAIAGPAAARLARTLDAALAPFPPEADPSFEAVLGLVRAGQGASALRALDEVVRESAAPPAWLTARREALGAVVSGAWRHAPEPVEPMTRDTVLARLRARDLPSALAAAKAAHASELAEVLARLIQGTEGLFSDSMADSDDPMTVPIEGHRLAEFHVRMGVLGEADRCYRAMLRDDPDDERARAMLADVIALRRALGESPEPVPPRPNAGVAWLKKNSPRAASEGWASGSSAGRYAAWADAPQEDSTATLDASQEAELLLKLGRAQQALDVYRILAIRHPNQQAYRKRIAEIEALIAQRMTPIDGEVTIRQDLSSLQAQAVPTSPRVVLPEFPSFGDENEVPTTVDRLRDDDHSKRRK